jgi:hypothetical protein
MSNQFAKFLAVALVAVAATTGVAHANYLTGTFAVTAVEGQTYGYGFSATNTNPFAGYSSGTTASATYSYTGALNLSNTNNSAPDLNSSFGYTAGNLSNYSGSGTVSYNSSTVADYSSLTSYLNSSGSGSGLAYGSWYSFDLGVLSAGTVLTITHDDGVSVWQNNLNLGNTVSGPTSQVTDNVKLTSTTDTMLYYTRQNGAPSILQVNVPEPSSIALMLAGLGGLAIIRRRRSRIAA